MVEQQFVGQAARVVDDAALVVLEDRCVGADQDVERATLKRIDVVLRVVGRVDIG